MNVRDLLKWRPASQPRSPDRDVADFGQRIKRLNLKAAWDFYSTCLLLGGAIAIAFVIHYAGVFLNWALGLQPWIKSVETYSIGSVLLLAIAGSLWNYGYSIYEAGRERYQGTPETPDTVKKGETDDDETK